jgi:hypothetical protein
MKSPRSVQQKVTLDAVFIAVAVILLILVAHSGAGTVNREKPPAFLGIYLVYIGVLFLRGYFFSDASYVLTGLMWICEHFSHPRGRYMALFYFGLSVLLGGCALLSAFGLLR